MRMFMRLCDEDREDAARLLRSKNRKNPECLECSDERRNRVPHPLALLWRKGGVRRILGAPNIRFLLCETVLPRHQAKRSSPMCLNCSSHHEVMVSAANPSLHFRDRGPRGLDPSFGSVGGSRASSGTARSPRAKSCQEPLSLIFPPSTSFHDRNKFLESVQ